MDNASMDDADAAKRFIASVKMDFDKWHDGTGYDLATLARVDGEPRQAIERLLIERRPIDWRDIEALATFDTVAARAAIRAAADHTDADVRREARRHLPSEAVDPKDRAARLLEALQSNDAIGALSSVIDEAAEFHPPAVIDALLRGARDRSGKVAVLFAALLFYIHDKAEEPFDWEHRPFFLRFDTPVRVERVAAFAELCTAIGVDANVVAPSAP